MNVELAARLGDTNDSYETVFVGEFTVTGQTGDTTIPSETSLSIDGGFPVDVLSKTSLTPSDFSPSNGDSKTTPVEFRLEFQYDGGATMSQTTCSVTVTETQTVPSSGVARWTFDDADTQSGTLVDSWGSNDVAINGATTGVSGANQTYTTNEAHELDGSGENLSASSTELAELTADNSYTVAFWFYPTRNEDGETFVSNYNGDGFLVRLRNNHTTDAVLEAYHRDEAVNKADVARASDGSTSFNSWNHFVAVRDGSGASGWTLYIDGGEDTVAVQSDGAPGSAGGNFSIGSYPDGRHPAQGRIDDLRLYNQPITATEVGNLRQTGSISG